MTHYMSQSNALTTAVQTNILGYLMHLTNQTNFPKQANTAHSVVNSQSQHQVPLCLQCHDGSYLSLSLSALQYLYCQANTNASGSNLKVTSQCKHPSSSTAPAHYWTSGVQLFTHYITHVATKPRSLTKQTRPSVVLMPTFLQSMATKPGHRPFRVLMPIFLNSVATKPRLLTLRGSHAELSQLCGN